MSVVAAMITSMDGESFEIGVSSDGQANYDGGFCVRSEEKILVLGSEGNQFLVGVVGSFRFRDLVWEDGFSDFAFRSQSDVRVFRNLLMGLMDDEVISHSVDANGLDFQMVLACGVGLFTLQSDLQISCHSSYCAVGEGSEVASGALYSGAKRSTGSALRVAMDAVEAACLHRVDCGYPITAKVLRRNKTGIVVQSSVLQEEELLGRVSRI